MVVGHLAYIFLYLLNNNNNIIIGGMSSHQTNYIFFLQTKRNIMVKGDRIHREMVVFNHQCNPKETSEIKLHN